MDIEPTLLLPLLPRWPFQRAALAPLPDDDPHRRDDGEGPGEQEEDEDDDAVVPTDPSPGQKPIPGPGAPFVPEPGTPDANPIDPRVFERADG